MFFKECKGKNRFIKCDNCRAINPEFLFVFGNLEKDFTNYICKNCVVEIGKNR